MTRNTTISEDALVARLRENVFRGTYRSDEFAEGCVDDVREVFGDLPWVIERDTIVAGDVRIPLDNLYTALRGTSIGGLRDATMRVIGGSLRGAGYRPTWTKVKPWRSARFPRSRFARSASRAVRGLSTLTVTRSMRTSSTATAAWCGTGRSDAFGAANSSCSTR